MYLGFALSILVGLPPIYGLYVSLIPPLIYCIFGTSRQLSLGTDSIISLLTASAVQNLESKFVPPINFNLLNSSIDTSNFLSFDRTAALVSLTQSITFYVAIIQLIMCVFQLGFLSIYLSNPLIAAFTSGAAVHIFTSQIENIFDIRLLKHIGLFRLPKVCNIKFNNFKIKFFLK